MKNFNDEITKFSLADDSDDYDEYEEEVIERDEEYDDEDDEEYEDEEYDDEEYDDEEPYEDEEYDDYDDGYDDQYYDDRLNQVLDELAELKRSMSQTPAVQNQQPFMPIQPHLLYSLPQQNSNEVVMYNEISRLRDELSKTQNSQSLHVELTRLKEDMEREKRQNETQFLSEIKRLNERIEELQQPAAAAKPALAGSQTAGYLPEAQTQHIPPKELGKLVGISESLLKTTRDSDARITADVGDVKTNVADTLSGVTDIKTVIAEIKAKLDTMPAAEDIKGSLDDIRAAIQVLEEHSQNPGCIDKLGGISSDIGEVAGLISSLKAAIGENTGSGSIDKKLLNKIARIKPESNGVDLTEIIRSVYEIKGMLGSNDPNQQALVNMALKAYTDLDLLHITVANSTDFRAKLEAVETFVAAVNEQDFVTPDALGAYNIVLKELMDTPLNKAVFDSLCSFATATGKITISSSKKDAINKYIAFADRAKREDIDIVMEFLPEMVTAVNDAEGSKNITSNSSLYDDILALNDERVAAKTEADKHTAETELKALISEFADLRVGDVVSYSPTMPLPTSDALSFADGDSVSDRLNALIQSVAELGEAVKSVSGGAQIVQPLDDTAATVQPELVSDVPAAAEGDIESVKSLLYALNAKLDLDELSAGLQQNFADVTARLADIENSIAGGTVTSGISGEQTEIPISGGAYDANAIVDSICDKIDGLAIDENTLSVLADLAAIKDKLSEHELLINQIADLRADVAALAENGDASQFDKLFDDIAAQFDKLYDDLTAVDGETADKLNDKLAEIKATVDEIVSSDLSASILDGIVDFRAAYEENQSLSGADRQKILDDLAVVRDQVQAWLDSQTNEGVTNENIADNLSALREEFSDNIKALEDKIAALDVAETNEQYAQANENITNLITNLSETLDEHVAAQEEASARSAEDHQAVIAALDEIRDKSASIEEVLATNGLIAAESQNALSEELNKILAQITPQQAEDGSIGNVLYDEVVALSDKLDLAKVTQEQTTADLTAMLAEIKEQVHLKELEQNLAAVTASEEEKKTLLTEIAGLRERLSALEAVQAEQAEESIAMLTTINEQIDAIGENVNAEKSEQLFGTVSGIDTRLSEYIAADVTAANIELLANDIAEIKSALEQGGANSVSEQTLEDIKTLIDDVAAVKEKVLSGSDDSALNMQILMADVADIKDKLSESAEEKSDFVRMQDDLTFIRNQIEANIDGGMEEDTIAESLESEGMSIIMDDIAAIKEKLSAFDDYDAVSEIISLREDVKSARMLDNTDITSELENLRNDLLELKADLSDIKSVRTVGQTVTVSSDSAAPTGDELNMVLSEIVSLRDEIQAYKDDVANMVAVQSEQATEPVEGGVHADEGINNVLDELTGLQAELSELKEVNFAEQSAELEDIKTAVADLKDMISRRTTIAEEGTGEITANSNELNVVLDEIVNIKDEIAQLKSDILTSANSEENADNVISVVDDLNEFKSDLYAMLDEKLAAVNPDISEDLQNVNEKLADLQAIALGGVAPEDSQEKNAILDELAQIREMLAGHEPTAQTEPAVSLDELYSEVISLRQDIDALRLSQPISTADGNFTVDLSPINEQLTALREELAAINTAPAAESEPDTAFLNEVHALRDEIAALYVDFENNHVTKTVDNELSDEVLREVLSLREELGLLRDEIADSHTATVAEGEPNNDVLGEVLSLRDELAALREEIANSHVVTATESEPDTAVLGEVLSLREELAALREEMNNMSAHEDVENDATVLSEILGIREDIERLREGVAASEDTAGLMETVDSIKEDVRSIKEEPDLSIINEVLALRDEFQAFKDELNKARTAPAEDKSKEELISEVQSLRDQLFAISMANVNDGTSNEVVYESYNNIILDEISALRDEIALIKKADESREISEELSQVKDKLTNMAIDDSERTEARFNELRTEIADLKAKDNSDTQNAVLAELASLKEELARQREADAATLNFMSEMARLLERQDAYINSSSDDGMRDEIEELKSEIASSVAASVANDDIRERINDIMDALGNVQGNTVNVDNSAVLKEIAALRTEIAKRDNSEDNRKILAEIARLKNEIGAITARDNADDGALTRSINDLKTELNQLAGFVEGEGEPQKSAPRTNKSGGKSTSANKPRKSGAKKGPAQKEESGLTTDSLISKIDATSIDIPNLGDDDLLVMNPDFTVEQAPIPATSAEMDIAAKLAKQVANKLIMEQLVEQLGDGGVPRSEVEEIVRDILPQEFTTIQVDEQSDKVRRLANSLVLDKLRSRLKK